MAGTEGTCGVITELTVRLVERPRATALAVLGFSDVFAAAAAAPLLRQPGVYTVEGMGADLLASHIPPAHSFLSAAISRDVR